MRVVESEREREREFREKIENLHCLILYSIELQLTPYFYDIMLLGVESNLSINSHDRCQEFQ